MTLSLSPFVCSFVRPSPFLSFRVLGVLSTPKEFQVSQESFKGVGSFKVFQESFEDVSSKFSGCLRKNSKGVSRKLRECFKEVSEKFHWCFK